MQAESPVAAEAPDWSATTERIACPLCDYDLRGLTAPRCPECGYQFVWNDLTDPARRQHPFVFEHHPEANVWSFFKTLFAGLRPRKFWTSLLPSQPSKPKRLAIYAIIVSLFASIIPIGMIVWEGVDLTLSNVESRRMSGWMYDPATGTRVQSKEQVERLFPLPPSPRFFAHLYSDARQLLPLLVVFVAWPWFTFAGLLAFQISMLRAKVNNVHVLRCVVYCFDTAVWHTVALSMLLGGFHYAGYREDSDGPVLSGLSLTLAFALWFTYRLWRGYKHYLRFERPLATVICAQAVAFFITFFVIVQLINLLGG